MIGNSSIFQVEESEDLKEEISLRQEIRRMKSILEGKTEQDE